MKIIKYTVVVFLCLLSPFHVLSQSSNTHEFSVVAGGGLSTLDYKTKIGKHENGVGGLLGLGYTYFVNDNWGISSGIEFSLLSAKTEFDAYTDKYAATDIDGTNFELKSEQKGYQDKQNATLLNIPIMVKYQTTGKYKIYGAGGLKFGIPIHATTTTKVSKTTNSGLYPGESEHTTQEFMGFGTFTNRKNKQDLKLKMAIMLSLEAGMKWSICDESRLYTGIYFDYGLNDINKKPGTTDLVEYNTENPKAFKNNSVLTSSYTNGTKGSIAKKVKPLAIGIKIAYAFDL